MTLPIRYRASLLTLTTSGLLAALLALGGCSGEDARGDLGDGPGGDGDLGVSGGDGDGDGDDDGDGAAGGSGSDGASGSGGSGGSGSGGGGQFVPTFPGAGTSPEANDPLVGGMLCHAVVGGDAPPIPPTTTRCFFEKGSDMQVYATIEQALECVEDANTVRLRLTFDPGFNDNTFGANSSEGWPAKRGHRYGDLVGSDHAELVLVDGDGNVAMQFKLDYITADPSAPSGYSALGVSGGDGSISIGDAADVVQWSTSLDRNLNERGYGSYTVDSPATDADYTPNPETPEWDYRVVFEAWVDLDAFGDSGFAGAFINYVHASPAKTSTDTIEIEPGPCPPPTCPPDGCEETPPGDGPNPECPDDPDGDCGTSTPPPDPLDPCADNDPDTFCGEGDPGDPPPVPAYCDLYPTDPACQLD